MRWSTRLNGRACGLAVGAAVALAGCATGQRDFHGAHSMPPAAPTSATPAQPAEAAPALELTRLTTLKDILPALSDKRVVYVGETHDIYAHHLTQLEIIKGVHAAGPQLAIGMEMFQQPFQSYLNDYIAGVLSEREMLVATEYFQRWSYDYRLYAPILRYARDNRLPVVALNVPGDLVEKVRVLGLDGLEEADRARLPAGIDRGNTRYEARLRQIFAQHPHTEGRGFERFLDGQLLWDEGMAERAARYLEEHPGHTLVVLAGSGHLAYGDGIPQRLKRRVPVEGAIVLNGWEGEISPDVGDYLLMPGGQALPAAGRIGAMLAQDEGGLKVESCTKDSACAAAGLERGDRLLAIDDIPVADLADVNTVMWDRKPDETVTLSLRRARWFAPAEERRIEIKLR